jgi:putative ABC transport system substrate-binding protein
MRRRDFITLLGSAAVALPPAAGAQQPPMPVIGYLSARSPADTAHLVDAFRRGLKETGFIEGQNVAIEYRWAFGEANQLPKLAAELVQKPVALFVTTGGESAALAAKAATSSIPIAFIIGGDPVKLGLVATYNRPVGNATGISILTANLEPKRLEFLRELVPQARIIGGLLDPNFPPFGAQVRDLREAAHALGVELQELRASTDDEIDAAFDTSAQQRIGAIVIAAGPFFDTRRDRLVTLAARYKVPTMYHFREFTEAGGLVSYGVDARPIHRQIGVYVRWDSQWGKAKRLAGAPAYQVRTSHQPENSKGSGAHSSAHTATCRRRNNRIATCFAAVHESANGMAPHRHRRTTRILFHHPRHFTSNNNRSAIGRRMKHRRNLYLSNPHPDLLFGMKP